MRFKAILPAILALFLIGNACFASACQAACDDAARGTTCHVAAAQGMSAMDSAGSSMAGMQRCAMCAQTAAIMAPAKAMSCSQEVCALPPLPQGHTNAYRLLRLEAPLLPAVADAVPMASYAAASGQPPLRRLASPPLHTILRV